MPVRAWPTIRPMAAKLVLALLACTVGTSAADDGPLLGSVAAFESDLGPGAPPGAVADPVAVALDKAKYTLDSAKHILDYAKVVMDSSKGTVDALSVLRPAKRGPPASGADAAASGAGGEPGDLDSSCLATALAASEAEYQENVKQRAETLRTWPARLGTKQKLKLVYLVPTYPCALERRIGDWMDGGKWVCLRHHNISTKPLALSIGCNGETSFERAVSELLHGFSHTVDFSLNKGLQARMAALPYMKFYNLGLSGAAEMKSAPPKFKNVFRTLPQVLTETGHSSFDVFKIDCEGCEIGVVEDMVKLYSRKKPRFGQILMEIHAVSTRHVLLLRLLQSLEDLGYRLFHVENNPSWADGYEVAYIHESLMMPRP